MWVCERAQWQTAMHTDEILFKVSNSPEVSQNLVHSNVATVVSKVSYLANSEFGVRFLGLTGHFITVLPVKKRGQVNFCFV